MQCFGEALFPNVPLEPPPPKPSKRIRARKHLCPIERELHLCQEMLGLPLVGQQAKWKVENNIQVRSMFVALLFSASATDNALGRFVSRDGDNAVLTKIMKLLLEPLEFWAYLSYNPDFFEKRYVFPYNHIVQSAFCDHPLDGAIGDFYSVSTPELRAFLRTQRGQVHVFVQLPHVERDLFLRELHALVQPRLVEHDERALV
jgi:hypothetical protein